ncbi:hypothetical protein Pth03_50760 [Planotetraspora thailandica]|uniref:Uncharacterized protein n=1 Tax=Planotetraspora thailandica TaxID=487172 RepID=A0A8J3V3G4_9ACTN|nr:hypothetical protein [Planotetraspora thailandica]GII56687.1 hypothetical protein Pth03_50760 [Planotetraspora thailandica]
MITLEDIARAHTGWTIWRSDVGRWWATRRGPVDFEALRSGFAMTVDADDAESLAAELVAQARLAAESTSGSASS